MLSTNAIASYDSVIMNTSWHVGTIGVMAVHERQEEDTKMGNEPDNNTISLSCDAAIVGNEIMGEQSIMVPDALSLRRDSSMGSEDGEGQGRRSKRVRERNEVSFVDRTV